MSTARETLLEMVLDPDNWEIPLMNLVDDYRRDLNQKRFEESIIKTGTRLDPLITAVVESLCDECDTQPPDWTEDIDGLKYPWFVSGMESLKAIAIVESPIRFRMKNIFVHTNFLSRA